VEQDAIDDTSAGRREISDQLQSIITGGGADEATVSAVLKSLGDKIAEMERGWRTNAPRNPGPIKLAHDEIADRDQRLSQMRPDVERAEQAKERLIGLAERIEEIHSELVPARSLVELFDRRLALEQEREEWGNKEAPLETRIEQVGDAQRRMAQASEELLEHADLEGVDSEVEQRVVTWRERVELLVQRVEAQSARLQQLRADQAEAAATKGSLPTGPLAGVGVGFVLLFIGVMVGLTASRPVGVVTGLLGLIVAAIFTFRFLTVLSERSSDDFGGQMATQQEDLRETQRLLQEATNELGDALGAHGCTTWDEFSEKLAGYRGLKREQEMAETQLDALLGDQTLEVLEEERRAASRRRRDAEEALREPEMRRVMEITPLQYQEIKRDVEQLEAELEGKREAERESRILRDVADHSIEDVHQQEEQKAAAERSLRYLEEQLAVRQLAREVIEEAKGQTMRSARDQLEPQIAESLRRITQGRYTEVSADDNLNLRVFSPEKGDWTSPDSSELSRGTLDQLYLAARLALVHLLYRDAKPPLLLDDPFVKFDAERRDQAIALCKEIGREHQVLLFTCHDDYDAAADVMVELPDPSL
jgi:uncharacterized protein YhaN